MSKSKGNAHRPARLVGRIGLEALVAKRTSGMCSPSSRPTSRSPRANSTRRALRRMGQDALRFSTLAAAGLAEPPTISAFDLGRVGGYRNFCNKLWRRGSLRRDVSGETVATDDGPVEYSMADQWIRSRFGQTNRGGRSGFFATIDSTSRPLRCMNLPGMHSATGISS